MDKKINKFLAVTRWHMQLGYSTIGFMGIGLVIAKTLQDILKQFIFIPLWILFPMGIFALWLIGFSYDKLGYYSTEMDYAFDKIAIFQKKEGDKKDGTNK